MSLNVLILDLLIPLINQTRGALFPQIITERVVSGTMFVAIADKDFDVTAHNLSFINAHGVAGPTIYRAG